MEARSKVSKYDCGCRCISRGHNVVILAGCAARYEMESSFHWTVRLKRRPLQPITPDVQLAWNANQGIKQQNATWTIKWTLLCFRSFFFHHAFSFLSSIMASVVCWANECSFLAPCFVNVVHPSNFKSSENSDKTIERSNQSIHLLRKRNSFDISRHFLTRVLSIFCRVSLNSFFYLRGWRFDLRRITNVWLTSWVSELQSSWVPPGRPRLWKTRVVREADGI